MQNSTDLIINIGLISTYVLLGIVVLGLLFFAGRQLITNPGRTKMTLFGAIGICVIFAAAMALSSGTDISEALFEKTGTNYGMSRLIGAGLYTFYILFACVVISVIAVEAMRPFKK